MQGKPKPHKSAKESLAESESWLGRGEEEGVSLLAALLRSLRSPCYLFESALVDKMCQAFSFKTLRLSFDCSLT